MNKFMENYRVISERYYLTHIGFTMRVLDWPNLYPYDIITKGNYHNHIGTSRKVKLFRIKGIDNAPAWSHFPRYEYTYRAPGC